MKLDDKYELVMPLTKEMTFYVEDILSQFGLQNRIKIILDEHIKYSFYYHAKLGIVTSGTAALEVSYFNTPYVTAYKFNPVTYFILQFLIKTRMGNLINIIQGKFIIPELLQSKSNKDNIMYYLKKFLDDNDYRQEVLSNASEATAKLKSQSTPSIMAAEKIIQIVNEKINLIILKLRSKALWYLQRYASSSENLRNYLRRKVKDSHLSINSEEIINEIIFSLERQKILNDQLFSESKIRNYLNKGWSLKKIEFKLKELYVKDNIIIDAIQNIRNSVKNIDLIAACRLAKKKSIGLIGKMNLQKK